jgi:hypothetical protein
MSRSSKKGIAAISTSSTNDTFLDVDENNDRLALLERKIAFAIEGFTTQKFCELILRDRRRLSKEMDIKLNRTRYMQNIHQLQFAPSSP